MKKQQLVLFIILGLFVFSGWVQAANEEGTEISESESVVMEEVVVTATRTETELDKVGGSSITVITAEDIEAKKQNTVEEVIRGIPGIDVAATGGLGQKTSVFIRGADSKNTLVLVDGIMFNDVSLPNRNANLANLTVDNIERIEVVRGPLSALYGSNATAGVINIITKKGKGKPTTHLGGEYGSYNTWKIYGGTSGQLSKFNYSATASRTETDGFSAANADNPDISHAGNTSEDDGYDNTTLSGKFGVDVTDDFDFNLVMRYMDSTVKIDDFNGFAADQWDFSTFPVTLVPDGPKKQNIKSDQLFYKFNIHNFFFERFFESDLYYKVSDQNRDIFDADDNFSSNLDGKIDELGWQGGLNWSDINILSSGYNYFEESLDQTDSTTKKANIRSYWASDQLFLFDDSFVTVGSVRIDDHSQFGTEPTWHLAPSYLIEQTDTTIKGSIGTGFRAPSLFELFADPFPSFGFLGGNPNLNAEKSKGWDAGFEQKLFESKFKIGGTYFYTRFEDKIEFVIDPITFASTYDNLEGTTKTKGVEAFVEWIPVKDLNLLLNYTYTKTEDPDGEPLVRRPENKVYFNTRYRFLKKGVVNLDVYWVDERKTFESAVDKNGNPVEKLDAYWLVNLSAYYDITKNIQLYGRIDNLFDEFYEESWSYATPGFSVYGGLKFQI